MLERIAETTYKYIMFAPGQTVGVAVSGGADSVALFHVLRALSARFDIRLRVLHFDHQLRGEASDADRRFVEELAASYELPFSLGRADVKALARESGDNLEAYLCGSPGMIDACVAVLTKKGVPEELIYYDKFA